MDKIVVRKPINATARRVTSRGIHFTPSGRICSELWSVPQQTYKPPSGVRDITGLKRGNMIVIGYMYSKVTRGKSSPYWLVRCCCGNYEPRNGRKYWKNRESQDSCQICRKLRYLKRRDQWRESNYGLTLTTKE